MKVRIHRGANEVGGSCVEVEAGDCRIVLDVGRPLGARRDDVIPLPDIAGFDAPDESLLALIISHGHQDHWGLIGQVPARVPVYIGRAAQRILKEAAFFSVGVALEPTGFLSHREPFELGPFTITPFLNDHSGFDTYSLLIEADGRRLFYSADLQGHSRKAAIFEELLRKPPSDVDVLLMEGTNLRPEGDPKSGKTEQEIEKDLIQTFSSAPRLVLAMYSAQNIDRLVTLFRACLQSDRFLVLDLYTASVAAATGNENIPKLGFEKVLIYVPLRQRIQVKAARQFERVHAIRAARIFPEELAARANELVVTFRASMIPELEKAGCLGGATAVWSQWAGYFEQPNSNRLLEFLRKYEIPLIQHHASGHAYTPDLQRLTRALAAKRVVPIHSFAPHRFQEFFDRVEVHDDGEWWDV